MKQRGLVEKPDKKKSAYQITQKGRDYLANPPQEPQGKVAKSGGVNGGGKVDEKVDEKELEEEKEDEEPAIPSQADIFQSVAEQLSISKQKEAKGGTPLCAVVYRVQRTAELNKASFRAFDQHKR